MPSWVTQNNYPSKGLQVRNLQKGFMMSFYSKLWQILLLFSTISPFHPKMRTFFFKAV